MDLKFLKRLRVFSIIEGISTLLLFGVAMPLKYAADMPMAVSIVGSLHGILFLGLVVMFYAAVEKVPMSWQLAFAGIIGAVIPFGPFVVDVKLRKLEQNPTEPQTAET